LIIFLPKRRKEINFNLKLTFMKTKIIIITAIITAFLFGGCTTKNNFDFKVTVVPESKSSVIPLNDLNTAAKIISKRLNNSFGIPQESLKLDVTESQISLTISNADTSKIASIKEIITGYARLEFWETYENAEIMGYLLKANNLLREMKSVADVKNTNTRDEFIAQNPLLGILKSRVTAQGEPLPSCMIGLASGTDTAKVNGYMQMPEIKALLPRELKLMWSRNPHKYDPSKTLYELHAIKVTTQEGKAPLDGSVIISAKPITGPTKSDIKIDLAMNAEGASTWARITRENVNRCIAIVLNGYVRSYPRVMDEISGGNTEITGDFTVKDANDLASILNSGSLPFELKIVDEQIIKRE
jgi:SecD/SecF fusion protein